MSNPLHLCYMYLMATKTLTKKKSPQPLTERDQRFITAYLLEPNATQAAIKAGFSQHTAAERGYEVRHKPSVAHALAKARATLAEASEVSKERLAEEYSKAALAEATDPVTQREKRSSLDSLAKLLGYVDSTKAPVQQGDTYNQVVLQGFTFEQLQELLGKMQPGVIPTLKEEPKAILAPKALVIEASKPKRSRKAKS